MSGRGNCKLFGIFAFNIKAETHKNKAIISNRCLLLKNTKAGNLDSV